MADHLVAPRHQPALAFGRRIRRPDLGQISGRIEAGERPGVDLVGLYMGVRDRLHLQRIGDHHRFTNGAKTRDTAMQLPVASITTSSVARSSLPSPPAPSASCRSGPHAAASLPDHHLAKGAVDIDPDHTSHPYLHLFDNRSGGATRQLRIRALSATGRVAEAASYEHELAAQRSDRPARTFVLPVPLSRMVAPYAAITQTTAETRHRSSHTGYQCY